VQYSISDDSVSWLRNLLTMPCRKRGRASLKEHLAGLTMYKCFRPRDYATMNGRLSWTLHITGLSPITIGLPVRYYSAARRICGPVNDSFHMIPPLTSRTEAGPHVTMILPMTATGGGARRVGVGESWLRGSRLRKAFESHFEMAAREKSCVEVCTLPVFILSVTTNEMYDLE